MGWVLSWLIVGFYSINEKIIVVSIYVDLESVVG